MQSCQRNFRGFFASCTGFPDKVHDLLRLHPGVLRREPDGNDKVFRAVNRDAFLMRRPELREQHPDFFRQPRDIATHVATAAPLLNFEQEKQQRGIPVIQVRTCFETDRGRLSTCDQRRPIRAPLRDRPAPRQRHHERIALGIRRSAGIHGFGTARHVFHFTRDTGRRQTKSPGLSCRRLTRSYSIWTEH
jgi:hypothetical protein